MQKNTKGVALILFAQIVLLGTTGLAGAQEAKDRYATMAPLNQFLMPDKNSEIALARSAAPKSISDEAEVMVLGPEGYSTAVKGSNGFLCLVERSWGAATTEPEFWNPSVRSPVCFNPQAASTVAPIFLMKTKLVLAGKSKEEIVGGIASAFDKKELPSLEPGAMCYMLSEQQYLNDQAKRWHPHLMFFIPGEAEKSWGGNLPGSPIIAANDSEERMTIFMVWVGKWSDGTPAPPIGK